MLKAGQSGVVEQIPLHQLIAPGDADHFLLTLGADKSSRVHVRVSFRAAGGERFNGGDLLVDIFRPRTAGPVVGSRR